MIVVLGLPLKLATIILGCIFSMLFSDFRACGPISIPTLPIVALTEFFHADAGASVHPIPESLCYVCICALECILYLCYVLLPIQSALVIVLFYLKL